MDLNGVTSLLGGLLSLTWDNVVMMAVGGILIYLAIVKDYEPMLLLPIGAGTILANLPLTGMTAGIRELQLHQPLPKELGLFGVLYRAGIQNELFPLLIFVGVGAMTDLPPAGKPQAGSDGGRRTVWHLWGYAVGSGCGFPS